MPLNPDALKPDPAIADQEFNVCLKTLGRWDRDPKTRFREFCPPYWINGRKYRRVRDVESYKDYLRRADPPQPPPSLDDEMPF